MNLKIVSKVLTKIGKYAKLKGQIITLTLDVLGDFFPKIFNLNFKNFYLITSAYQKWHVTQIKNHEETNVCIVNRRHVCFDYSC